VASKVAAAAAPVGSTKVSLQLPGFDFTSKLLHYYIRKKILSGNNAVWIILFWKM
jgi:uncharacterized protein YdhG (YjbR/CyaY superfamily)